MRTTIQTTWHGLTIPDCLEPVDRPTARSLRLRLSAESDRRTWELYFDAYRSAVWMNATLFVMPWRSRDCRQWELSDVSELAVSLLQKRGSCSHGPDFVSFENFEHTPGMQVLQAMLGAVARQLAAASALVGSECR